MRLIPILTRKKPDINRNFVRETAHLSLEPVQNKFSSLFCTEHESTTERRITLNPKLPCTGYMVLPPRGAEARQSGRYYDNRVRCGRNLPRSGRVSNVCSKQKLVALDLVKILGVWRGFEVLGVAKNLVQHVWGQIGECDP